MHSEFEGNAITDSCGQFWKSLSSNEMILAGKLKLSRLGIDENAFVENDLMMYPSPMKPIVLIAVFSNARDPIEVSFVGEVKEVRLVHPENAFGSIVSSLELGPNETVRREVQPEKVPSPIERRFEPSANETTSRFEHPKNEFASSL